MQPEFMSLYKILLRCYWTLIVGCSALQISQMCLDLVLENDKCIFRLSKNHEKNMNSALRTKL